MSGQLHGFLHPNAIAPLMWLPEALNRIINKTFTNGVEQGFFCLHNFDFILVSSQVHWYMYLHWWFHLSYMYTCSVIFAWIVGIMTNLLFQANMLPTYHALQSCICKNAIVCHLHVHKSVAWLSLDFICSGQADIILFFPVTLGY